MNALAAAIATAAFALLAKIAFDLWANLNLRRNVAGALAGELEAYFEYIDLMVPGFTALAKGTREHRIEVLAHLPNLPTTHPAFDKLADKIGFLRHGDAYGVSLAYNAVTGMRLNLMQMAKPEFLAGSDDLHQHRLEVLGGMLAREAVKTRALIERLQRVSRQGLWSFALGLER